MTVIFQCNIFFKWLCFPILLLKVGEARRWACKTASIWEHSTKTGPELQRGADHQDQYRSECSAPVLAMLIIYDIIHFLIVDLLMFDYRIAWWEMQVIKQAFPKLINLLQNIKKKEAAGAKTRPAAGGLLPPPPGAKAGGLIPPPGGQQSFPPVQTNNGEHQCLCQTPVYLSLFIKQYSFSPISPSFRLWLPCSCSPAQLWCVGGFYICRLQVSFLIPSCPSVFIIVFEFYISSPSSLSFSPPFLSSSSKDAAKSGWVQFSWVVRSPCTHSGSIHSMVRAIKAGRKLREELISSDGDSILPPSVKIPSTQTITQNTLMEQTVKCKYIVTTFSSHSAMQW